MVLHLQKGQQNVPRVQHGQYLDQMLEPIAYLFGGLWKRQGLVRLAQRLQRILHQRPRAYKDSNGALEYLGLEQGQLREGVRLLLAVDDVLGD